MLGGFHIEMAALKTLGDWLRGSDWVQALVQADIATTRTDDSLRAAHVIRTRRAYQIIQRHCTSCNTVRINPTV